jgi:hypothetical protein
MRRSIASDLLFLVSATILAVALGRLVYHYVLFQGTILALIDF